eukprot:EG_transcript_35685
MKKTGVAVILPTPGSLHLLSSPPRATMVAWLPDDGCIVPVKWGRLPPTAVPAEQVGIPTQHHFGLLPMWVAAKHPFHGHCFQSTVVFVSTKPATTCFAAFHCTLPLG